MTQSVIHPHAASDEGIVNLDVPCQFCNYNLRSLHEQAKCPECGASVASSLSRTLLRFAAAEWLRYLWIGATLNLIGLCLPLVLVVLAGLMFLEIPAHPALRLLVGMTLFIAPCLILAGSWLATSPEPVRNGIGHEANHHRRKARVSIQISLVALLVAVFSAAFAILVPPMLFLILIGSLVATGCTFVWHLHLIYSLAMTLRRVPSVKTAEFAEKMGSLLGAIVLFLGLAALTTFAHPFVGGFFALIAIATGAAGWASYFFLLLRSAQVFKREYQASLQTRQAS